MNEVHEASPAAAPDPPIPDPFIIKLFYQGEPVKYVGADADRWCKIYTTRDLKFHFVHYNGDVYYQKADDTKEYLSVNSKNEVSLSDRAGATSFLYDHLNKVLKSKLNSQMLSCDNTATGSKLYCDNSKKILEVELA